MHWSKHYFIDTPKKLERHTCEFMYFYSIGLQVPIRNSAPDRAIWTHQATARRRVLNPVFHTIQHSTTALVYVLWSMHKHRNQLVSDIIDIIRHTSHIIIVSFTRHIPPSYSHSNHLCSAIISHLDHSLIFTTLHKSCVYFTSHSAVVHIKSFSNTSGYNLSSHTYQIRINHCHTYQVIQHAVISKKSQQSC